MARVPKVKFKINLAEIFGSRDFGRGTKEAIGQAVIDRIVERTQTGIDKNGKRFKGYSAAYKDSLAFKVNGKSDLVNLTLTEDMLSSMTIIEQTAQTITIGFDDSTENAKAYGHISGMEGHPTIKKGKVRDFLGLPQRDIDLITDEFQSEVDIVSSIGRSGSREAFEDNILRAIDALTGEIEGE